MGQCANYKCHWDDGPFVSSRPKHLGIVKITDSKISRIKKREDEAIQIILKKMTINNNN